MIWIIASLPFWVLGLALFVGGFACLTHQDPGETHADLVIQFIMGLFLGTGLMMIAAWLCT